MMGEPLGGGLLSGMSLDKGLKGLQLAGKLAGGEQQPMAAPMQRPQSAPAMSNQQLAELYKRIYGGMYV